MNRKKKTAFFLLLFFLVFCVSAGWIQAAGRTSDQDLPLPLSSEEIPDGNYMIVAEDAYGNTGALHARGNAVTGDLLDIVPVSYGDASQIIGIRRSEVYDTEGSYYLCCQRAGLVASADGNPESVTGIVLLKSLQVTLASRWLVQKAGDGYALSAIDHPDRRIAPVSDRLTGTSNPVAFQKTAASDPKCRFRLYPVGEAPSYTEREGTVSERPVFNSLEILKANQKSLAQNMPSDIRQYIRTEGNFISSTIVSNDTSTLNGTHWLASDLTEAAAAVSGQWRTDLLPYYRFIMDREDTGETITVDYPVCGVIRGKDCGALVTFSDMRFSDECFAAYDKSSGSYRRVMKIATRLCGGFSRTGIQSLKMTVSFYDSVTKETVLPAGAALSFDSLNGSKDYSTDSISAGVLSDYIRELQTGQNNGLHEAADCYGEFVGYYDGRNGARGFTWGGRVNASSGRGASEEGSNILAASMEIRSPYSRDRTLGVMPVFIAQRETESFTKTKYAASWTDTQGAADFKRNSVSLMLDEAASTEFLIGGFAYAEQWTAFSAESDDVRFEEPLQTIAAARNPQSANTFEDTLISEDGSSAILPRKGEAVLAVSFRMPEPVSDHRSVLSSLSVTDTLPQGITVQRCILENEAGEEITSSAGVLKISGKTVTYDFMSTYLSQEAHYGKTLTFYLTCLLDGEAVPGRNYGNKAWFHVNGTAAENSHSSNEVILQCKEGSFFFSAVWHDGGNALGDRPASLSVSLLKDGVVYDRTELSGNGDRWEKAAEGLPFGNAAGKVFCWSAEAPAPARYSGSFSEDGQGDVLTFFREPIETCAVGKESCFAGEAVLRKVASTIPGYIAFEGSEMKLTETLHPSLAYGGNTEVSLCVGEISNEGQLTENGEKMTLIRGTDYLLTEPSGTMRTLSVELTAVGRKKAGGMSDRILLWTYRYCLTEKAEAGEEIRPEAFVIFRNGSEDAAPPGTEDTGGDPARRSQCSLVSAGIRTGSITVRNTAAVRGITAQGSEYTVVQEMDGSLYPVRSSGTGIYGAYGSEGYGSMTEELRLTIGEDGTASFTGLPDGKYELVETKAAQGHTLLQKAIPFTVSKANPSPHITVHSGLFLIYDSPATGGQGGGMWIATGAVILCIAGGGGLLFLRKRINGNKTNVM